ncbi:hypothetical protein BDB00DRAFT_942533 [Zychaea mexicana]|uniref:uncharacterized protein n=1 Tax=Zychaea mexicana TaxID=64656 RepID=UPI0022FE7618|nr:uncharacterized protein BDB00DRAFT_942533 [Zychaea mexicana]KAI9488065.1 hypothetical protein BDB00DRAFT_942533 [Zychaea mexicana]
MSSAPHCRCGRECVSYEVRKPGPNRGKWFWRCATQACGYFKWDTSASKFTVHPTNAYALAQPAVTLSRGSGPGGFMNKPNLDAQYFIEKASKKKTEIEFRLHSTSEITIRADLNPTLLPALQNISNAVWNEALQRWLLPATSQAYARALQQIPLAPNLNLNVIRLSNALKQVLHEQTGLSDHTVDIRETDVEETIRNIRDSALWKTLKPFQQQGVRCALKRNGRLLLADQVGKKLQALSVALAYQSEWPLLIICPKDDQPEWHRLVMDWLPVTEKDIHVSTAVTNILGKTRKRTIASAVQKGLLVKSKKRKTKTVSATVRRARRFIQTQASATSDSSSGDDDDDEEEEEEEEEEIMGTNDDNNDGENKYNVSLFSSHKIHIVNDELANKCHKQLLERHFRVIICDKSHSYLKYLPRKRAQHYLPMLKSCNRLVMLTDDFNFEKPIELFTQLSALRPDLFSDFRRYGQHYCKAAQQVFGWDYSGRNNPVELRYIVDRAIWLKRTKEDVQDQLPLV